MKNCKNRHNKIHMVKQTTLANAKHGINIGVMMSTVCQTHWLSFTHNRRHKQSAHRGRESARARQRGWTTHQHLDSVQPRHIKALLRPFICVCACKSNSILWTCAHTHTHTSACAQALTALALCSSGSSSGSSSSIQGWVGEVKDFAVDGGITCLSSLCQGGEGDDCLPAVSERKKEKTEVSAVSETALSSPHVTYCFTFTPRLPPLPPSLKGDTSRCVFRNSCEAFRRDFRSM